MSLAPWLGPVWRTLSDALSAGRLHHALLIAGADGLGKRGLANALIAAALCGSRGADGNACGRCRSCLLLAAGSHPDSIRVSFEAREDGKLRSELTIDQIRSLSQRLALASQFGGLQLALIDPAHAMNASASNALLKTLEEPTPSSVIVLISDRPSRLSATIRSRCQRIEVNQPSRAVAQDWLEQQGLEPSIAGDALLASLGNPGRALELLRADGLALRADCLRDLDQLAAGRTSAITLADAWSADRPQERLWFAALSARELAGRIAAGSAGTGGLTARAQIPKLAMWFDQANRARMLLDTPLRAELLILGLLRAWPPATTRTAAKVARSAATHEAN